MPTKLDRDAVKRRLDDSDLRGLFIEDLGWDHGGDDVEATVAGRTFALQAVAHKRGMVAYRYAADSDFNAADRSATGRTDGSSRSSPAPRIVVDPAAGGCGGRNGKPAGPGGGPPASASPPRRRRRRGRASR